MAKHRRKTAGFTRRFAVASLAAAGTTALVPGVANAAVVTVPNTDASFEVAGIENIPGIANIPGIEAWIPELAGKATAGADVRAAIEQARTLPLASHPAFSQFLDQAAAAVGYEARVEVPVAAPAPEPAPAPAPVAAPSVGDQIVAAARSKIGSPYGWGAAGPNAFDCSGLTSWAYAQVGKSIPRTSSAQAAQGTPVPLDQLQPGDIVAYYSGASHVAIYVGNGMMIDSLNSGTTVQERPLNMMPIHSAVRF